MGIWLVLLFFFHFWGFGRGGFTWEWNETVVVYFSKLPTDITYIKQEKDFAYFAAVIDCNSKNVLAWKLSNTMDVSLTKWVLQQALDNYPKPEIFNTDQGSQYTEKEHIKILKDNIRNDFYLSEESKALYFASI